jgi:hypothetical protein
MDGDLEALHAELGAEIERRSPRHIAKVAEALEDRSGHAPEPAVRPPTRPVEEWQPGRPEMAPITELRAEQAT